MYHGVINIVLPSATIEEIYIHDSNGKLVKQLSRHMVIDSMLKIDVNDLEKGLYMMSTRDQNGNKIAAKFVVD